LIIFDLSNELRTKIYKTYDIISELNHLGEGALGELEELKGLLGNVTIELERYLKN